MEPPRWGDALVMGRTRGKRARFLEKRTDWKSVEWTNRDRMCMIRDRDDCCEFIHPIAIESDFDW